MMQGIIQMQEFFAMFAGSGKLLKPPQRLSGKILLAVRGLVARYGQSVVAVPMEPGDSQARDSNPYWVANRARVIVNRDGIFVVSAFWDSQAPQLQRSLDSVTVTVIGRKEARRMLAPAANSVVSK